jgi:hypothetical protein
MPMATLSIRSLGYLFGGMILFLIAAASVFQNMNPM